MTQKNIASQFADQSATDIKVGALVVRRKRPGFDQEWGAEVESKAREALEETPYEVFFSDKLIDDDRSLRTALDECRSQKINALVVLQPTMSDGQLAPALAQQWDLPVVLWATPERAERISANSLVGTHIFASTFRQLRHPFELVYGMPGSESVSKQLDDAVRVVYTIARLRSSKLGLIGNHAPGFVDMHIDPYLLGDELGVQVSHTSLPAFLSSMDEVAAEDIENDVERVHELELPLEEVSADDLPLASRYYLTLSNHMEEENLDGVALRDWSELAEEVGQWPYLPIARLLSQGRAVAMEGDVDGALSCLIGHSLGCGAVYISDWLEHTDDVVALWHTGNAPFQLCKPIGSDGGPRIARHFNNNDPTVIEADLRPDMPVTMYRVWHCDNEYRMMAFEGQTIPPPKHFKGTNGFAQVKNCSLNHLFKRLCQEGMPHHVSVVEGHYANFFERFARRVNINFIEA